MAFSECRCVFSAGVLFLLQCVWNSLIAKATNLFVFSLSISILQHLLRELSVYFLAFKTRCAAPLLRHAFSRYLQLFLLFLLYKMVDVFLEVAVVFGWLWVVHLNHSMVLVLSGLWGKLRSDVHFALLGVDAPFLFIVAVKWCIRPFKDLAGLFPTNSSWFRNPSSLNTLNHDQKILLLDFYRFY